MLLQLVIISFLALKTAAICPAVSPNVCNVARNYTAEAHGHIVCEKPGTLDPDLKQQIGEPCQTPAEEYCVASCLSVSGCRTYEWNLHKHSCTLFAGKVAGPGFTPNKLSKYSVSSVQCWQYNDCPPFGSVFLLQATSDELGTRLFSAGKFTNAQVFPNSNGDYPNWFYEQNQTGGAITTYARGSDYGPYILSAILNTDGGPDYTLVQVDPSKPNCRNCFPRASLNCNITGSGTERLVKCGLPSDIDPMGEFNQFTYDHPEIRYPDLYISRRDSTKQVATVRTDPVQPVSGSYLYSLKVH